MKKANIRYNLSAVPGGKPYTVYTVRTSRLCVCTSCTSNTNVADPVPFLPDLVPDQDPAFT